MGQRYRAASPDRHEQRRCRQAHSRQRAAGGDGPHGGPAAPAPDRLRDGPAAGARPAAGPGQARARFCLVGQGPRPVRALLRLGLGRARPAHVFVRARAGHAVDAGRRARLLRPRRCGAAGGAARAFGVGALARVRRDDRRRARGRRPAACAADAAGRARPAAVRVGRRRRRGDGRRLRRDPAGARPGADAGLPHALLHARQQPRLHAGRRGAPRSPVDDRLVRMRRRDAADGSGAHFVRPVHRSSSSSAPDRRSCSKSDGRCGRGSAGSVSTSWSRRRRAMSRRRDRVGRRSCSACRRSCSARYPAIVCP